VSWRLGRRTESICSGPKTRAMSGEFRFPVVGDIVNPGHVCVSRGTDASENQADIQLV
jgi:hypothetical protein